MLVKLTDDKKELSQSEQECVDGGGDENPFSPVVCLSIMIREWWISCQRNDAIGISMYDTERAQH